MEVGLGTDIQSPGHGELQKLLFGDMKQWLRD
jgi:hypothetical protein